MKHQICVNATGFIQSIRDAAIYANKGASDRGTDFVILIVHPRMKKLAITACDGFGYYERRLCLEHCKRQPKPSLPGKDMRIVIATDDVAMLVKFTPARLNGQIQLNVDDEQIVNDNFLVSLTLPNGASTTFFSKINVDLPDLASIRNRAEKGKRKKTAISALYIPVRELARAGKVFPGKSSMAQIFTSEGPNQGVMALLECKNDENDISVIFMLQNSIETAA